jgi:hypothetical protein
MSHGTCSYIRMYINTVADSVMLYLQHDFYNIIFKIKHESYIATGLAPPPPRKHCGWSPSQSKRKSKGSLPHPRREGI